MIGLLTTQGWLDLKPGTISVDIENPFFDFDSVPGATTYPFGIPMTPGNLRRLNFPHVRALQGELIAPEPTGMYVDGLPWRPVGSLLYEDCDEVNQTLQYRFVADASDLRAQIDGQTLDQLDLGSEPLVLTHDADYYALPCVVNKAFYGDKNSDFKGVLNYYTGGNYARNIGANRYAVVPYLRLVPLLHLVFGAVGYRVSGSWLSAPEVGQLLVHHDRALDQLTSGGENEYAATLQRNQHVPKLEVGKFLVALQKLLGVGIDFHPNRRELLFTSLADVVADPTYLDRTAGPGRLRPAPASGYTLKMGLESDDELNKTLDTGWAELRVGAGKTVLDTDAGTLHMVRDVDPVDPARTWLTPALSMKGASPAFEAGNDSRAGLRLLFDRGLQPDAAGNLYPLATSGTVNAQGATVGTRSLHWDGPAGLYQQAHKPWLDFLDAAGEEERTVPFRVADLLSLRPGLKEMIGGRKYLWQKVSLSIPTGPAPLSTARITYRRIRL